MLRTATLVCIGLCLAAPEALADTNDGTVAVASGGLFVRLCPTVAEEGGPNILGAAVNTAGIARATMAAKVDGRVFLVGATNLREAEARVATLTSCEVAAAPARPSGLGGLLARFFGF